MMNLLRKLGILGDMAMRIGYFDPIQLTFNLTNVLMRKGIISYDEARDMIRASLPAEMPEDQKEAVLNSLVKKVN